MNFEFSDALLQLKDQARRFLAEHATPRHARQVLDGAAPYDRALWQGMAGMGWMGAAIPERHGGAGLGHEALCVLAEELGRAVAAVPFSSSVYLATEAILLAGDDALHAEYLPRLADGSVIGCLGWASGPGNPGAEAITAQLADGRLSGVFWPVGDGGIADFAILPARDAGGAIRLVLAELPGPGVAVTTLSSIDPTRNQVRLECDAAPVRVLPGDGWASLQSVLQRAAVLVAFEQLGGAAACLDMAVAYAKDRFAFGRPIGSFQAIKHKLADIYIAAELARSNAYYGAWALSTDAAELPLAAAAARVSATEAYHLASKENIQTHGGMGFTWEADCHLFYRRARLLALCLGSAPYWKDRLVSQLELRNAA